MAKEPSRASSAEDIEPPVRYVELVHLRQKDGAPVVVRVEGTGEAPLLSALKVVPGEVPPAIKDSRKVAGEPTHAEKMTAVEEMLSYGPPLIEAACFFENADGGATQAFWFTKPIPGALPGRILRVEDISLLVNAIFELGGYTGGAAKESAFPGRNGKGADGGSGDPADRPDAGDASVDGGGGPGAQDGADAGAAGGAG